MPIVNGLQVMRRYLPNYRESTVTVGDISLFYRRFGKAPGTAPVLLLLHGGWATGELNWGGHYKTLAKHFDVISPDQRGHGRSTNPSGKFASYAQHTWDIIGFCETLNLNNIRVMGHSSGALISLHMSVFDPERIDRQVLIGIHPFIGVSTTYQNGMAKFFATPEPASPPKKLDYIWKYPWRALALWWVHRDPDWYTLLKQNWAFWLKPLSLSEADYSKIKCPSLVVIGTEDEFGTPDEARVLANRIAESEFVPIDGGKHMMVVDQPETLQRAVLPFLMSNALD